MDIDDMSLVKQLGTLIRDKKYGKALSLCISSEIEVMKFIRNKQFLS